MSVFRLTISARRARGASTKQKLQKDTEMHVYSYLSAVDPPQNEVRQTAGRRLYNTTEGHTGSYAGFASHFQYQYRA